MYLALITVTLVFSKHNKCANVCCMAFQQQYIDMTLEAIADIITCKGTHVASKANKIVATTL